MYVCLCVCVYVCKCEYIYIYIYITANLKYRQTYIHTYIYIRACIYICALCVGGRACAKRTHTRALYTDTDT